MRQRAGTNDVIRPPFLALAYIILAVFALLPRFAAVGNHDVSWLMIAAQKWWHEGAVFGIDIVEPAPPSVMLLYLPGLWLADLAGIPPLVAADIWTILITLVCGQLIGLVYAHHEKLTFNAPAPVLAFVLSFSVLAFVPTQEFGERDVIIAALILPYALFQVGHAHAPAPGPLRWAVTIAAILGCCIKPQYALLVVFVILERIMSLGLRSGLKAADVPAFAVAGIAYVAGTYWFFPEWAEQVPAMTPLYTAMQWSIGSTLLFVFGFGCAVAALLAGSRLKFTGSRYFLAGFLLAAATLMIVIIERRPWGYHLMPITLVALVSTALVFIHSLKPLSSLFAHKAWTALLVCLVPLFFAQRAFIANGVEKQVFTSSELFGFFQESAEPGEQISFISLALMPGFPLVHAGEYRWASRFPCLWIFSILMEDAAAKAVERPVAQALVDKTVAGVVDDLRSFAPVAIAIQDEPANLPLMNGQALKSILDRDPAFRIAMRDYVFQGRADNHLIYLHSDRAAKLSLDRRRPATGR